MADTKETIAEISDIFRNAKNRDDICPMLADGEACEYCTLGDHGYNCPFIKIADRIEAAWKRQEQCYLDQIRDAMNMAGHEQYMREHAPICNAIINTWKYPLTNLGHRGNQNRGPKTPVSLVRDADGCVLMSFTGEPYRTNAEAIAKASEFCAAMNEWHERVGKADRLGNAAAMREALVEIERRVNSLDEECGVDPIEVRDIARAALKKPPRNCDLYDNKTDAETWFVEETGEDDREQHYWQMFANWLFWKAEERKGETDGSK